MEIKDFKQIKIADYLAKIGITPAKQYGNFLYYKAPYRTDKQPSFKVNTVNNLWFDISTGAGGSVIDLVCLVENCNVATALQKLSKNEFKSFVFQSENISADLQIKHIQPLQNKALIQYLQNRKIALPLAKIYLNEAYYSINSKQYFALAFKNNSDGYELRNKYFKGSTSPKDFTTLPAPNGNGLNIFEGFFDFLSALTYYGINQPTQTTIILNSTANLTKAVPELQKFSNCNAYLDTDKSGAQTFEKIQSIIPKAKNRANEIYPAFKDFNEFLCQRF